MTLTTPWDELLQTFADEQIAVPRIRPHQREGLMRPSHTLWTNRPDVDPIQMYLFTSPILEVLEAPVDPYVAISYTGHGLNSNSYVLNLVERRVAIFMQFSVGPVYTDFMACRLKIAHGFLMLDRILANLPPAEGEVDYVLALSNLWGNILLEREPGAEMTETQLLGAVAGWRAVDHEAMAASDGGGTSLDGGIFEWQEPMDFLVAASKCLVSSMPGNVLGRG